MVPSPYLGDCPQMMYVSQCFEILLKGWDILVTQDTEKKGKMVNILALIINFRAVVTQSDYLFSENSNPFVPSWLLLEKCF